MVEQEAVNFEVAGSSPVPGATKRMRTDRFFFFCRDVVGRVYIDCRYVIIKRL